MLLLVCARRSTAINSRAHAVMSHTHTTRSNNASCEYYEEGKSMGTYIFQAEVFLFLCGMWIRRLSCLLLSPCTDTRGSASKRNESAGAKRPLARATLPHKINERERRRNRAAIGCEMCFFFYITRCARAISVYYVNQLGSPLGIIPYGFNATCEVK